MANLPAPMSGDVSAPITSLSTPTMPKGDGNPPTAEPPTPLRSNVDLAGEVPVGVVEATSGEAAGLSEELSMEIVKIASLLEQLLMEIMETISTSEGTPVKIMEAGSGPSGQDPKEWWTSREVLHQCSPPSIFHSWCVPLAPHRKTSRLSWS